LHIENLLETVKRVHFIGIGGAGMCPLAEILHRGGYALSGSDNNESDTLRHIMDLGIPVTLGHAPQNTDGAEMVVYSAAIPKSNHELADALEKGIPCFKRSELFGAVSRMHKNCVGICGTHGKTTATAMTTQILIKAGMSPNALIGGRLPLTNSYSVAGESDVFVCEACEYADTFLDLSPKCSVILNVDADHLEYFKTIENLIASFTKFADMSDTVIYNADDANTKTAVKGLKGKAFVTFGKKTENNWSYGNVSMKNGAFPCFDVLRDGKYAGRAELNIPGEHNILNALAAIAASVYAGAAVEDSIKYAGGFAGAGRRFEKLAEINGITVADDYAHHPAELEAVLKAAKKMDYSRVIAIFQPFTFSRTSNLFNEFVSALKIPDIVIMTEIMGSREVNTYNISTANLAEKIENSVWFDGFDKIADYTASIAKNGDLIITLGCGDVYKIAKILIERMYKK